jgi:hypothetical protein
MCKRRIVVAALLWFLMDVAATAQTLGNEVYEWCRSSRPMAIAYTVGVFDQAGRVTFTLGTTVRMPKNTSVDAVLNMAQELLVGHCIPAEQVTLNQMTDVFCAYLKDAPEKRREPATFLFQEAMKKAWPCPKAH